MTRVDERPSEMMTTPTAAEADLLAQTRRIAGTVLRTWAPVADKDNIFPAASVQALRASGLLGYFVPATLGGLGGSVATYAQIAAALGEECLSTAIIWAMHGQQVAVLADHEFAKRDEVLRRVARDGLLVGSVTTEAGKGGDLLHTNAPVSRASGALRIVRDAPLVSFGREAELFLVTMRAEGESDHTVLALVERTDGSIEAVGGWNALGMRGTQSVPMHFDVTIAPDRLVGTSFRELAIRSMIPIGHVGWAAAWHGAARGLFGRVVRRLRAPNGQRHTRLDSEALRFRLASMRLSLDLVGSLLEAVCTRLDDLRGSGLGLSLPEMDAGYDDIPFTIMVNNLKVAASQLSFNVANGLLDVCGLFGGYVDQDGLGAERVFRDLRSGTLMYHNDRLLRANGSLLLVEGSRLGQVWSGG
jgi:acyl-CoA dehydrogenase